MANQVIKIPTLHVNISPDAFHLWARHYYKCKHDFVSPDRFSPVPYFLVCRAIELQLKAFHLRNSSQKEVKDRFGHDLTRSYSNLPVDYQILSTCQLDELKKANEIYKGKGFEYFQPAHALSGYSSFPDLEILSDACERLLEHE